MRVKRVLVLCLMLACLMACATTGTNQPMTTQQVYMEAQTAYINAWESYHSVWTAIPEGDNRRAQWVHDYHPIFFKAATLLGQFRVDPSTTNEQLLTTALNECQNILVQLAITKGVK